MSPHRRGGAALETALLMPAFLGLLTGAVELAWYYHRWYAVQEAAAAGARAASVQPDRAGVEASAEDAADAELARYRITGATVTTELATGDPETVTVGIEITHHSLCGLVPMPGTIAASVGRIYEDPGT